MTTSINSTNTFINRTFNIRRTNISNIIVNITISMYKIILTTIHINNNSIWINSRPIINLIYSPISSKFITIKIKTLTRKIKISNIIINISTITNKSNK